MSTNPGSEGVNSVPLANLAATTSSTLNQITPSDNGLQGLTSSLTPGSAAGSSSGPADTLKPPRSISDVKKSSRSLRLRVVFVALIVATGLLIFVVGLLPYDTPSEEPKQLWQQICYIFFRVVSVMCFFVSYLIHEEWWAF